MFFSIGIKISRDILIICHITLLNDTHTIRGIFTHIFTCILLTSFNININLVVFFLTFIAFFNILNNFFWQVLINIVFKDICLSLRSVILIVDDNHTNIFTITHTRFNIIHTWIFFLYHNLRHIVLDITDNFLTNDIRVNFNIIFIQGFIWTSILTKDFINVILTMMIVTCIKGFYSLIYVIRLFMHNFMVSTLGFVTTTSNY